MNTQTVLGKVMFLPFSEKATPREVNFPGTQILNGDPECKTSLSEPTPGLLVTAPLRPAMWSVSWSPQPLEASSRVVSPDGGLGSLPKQDRSPETARCQFPRPPPQFYPCAQICSTITEFLGQVQVTKESLSVVSIVSTQSMLQTQAEAKWEITSF